MFRSSDYSSSEISSMQEDAIRRVREMQRIAREKINHTNSRNNNQLKNNSVNEPKISSNISVIDTQVKNNNSFNLSELFKLNLNIDDDKVIILLLILVLSIEGADTILILALCYLLM